MFDLVVKEGLYHCFVSCRAPANKDTTYRFLFCQNIF